MKPAELPVSGAGQASGQDTRLGADAGEQRDQREDLAGTAPEPVEPAASEQDRGVPHDEAPGRGDRTHGQATRVMIASAVTSFFACLYLEFGDGLFLGAAGTALALVVYWVAEHNRSRLGRP